MNAKSNDKNGKKVISVLSCGLKFGQPPCDAAFFLDLRGFVNPYWDETLRPHTGACAPVAAFLRADPEVQSLLASLPPLLRAVLPGLLKRSNYHDEIKLVFGCTGGKHRSRFLAIAVVEMVKAIVAEHPEWDCPVVLIHRDQGRE